MKVAIFDVCETIYKVNTTFSFLDNYFYKNKKYIFFRRFAKFLPVKIIAYLFYKIFKKDLIRVCATFFLKGNDVKKVKKYAYDHVNNYLKNKINQEIFKMIKHYKSQGYQIVLMSGSYSFLIEEVAKYLNINFFYASNLCIADKCYTGKYDDDILFNKFDILKNKFKQIEKLIVVSNNKTDLELMTFADQSFAICNKKSDFEFWKVYPNIIIMKNY